MSLLDEFGADFCVMEKTRVPDGEGGFSTQWTEGATFRAAVRHDTTISARVAERADTASTYTFLIPAALGLAPYDVVKRATDGETFRITSHSGETFTPSTSALKLSAVTAERWALR